MQKISYEGERVETGPLQIGDDWPGTFIRGDNSNSYRLAVLQAMVLLSDSPGERDATRVLAMSMLSDLEHLLGECNLGKTSK